MEDRTPREMETREKVARKRKWQPPSKLPMPEKRDGWEHKWIRKSSFGTLDDSNMSSKTREGYVPVKLEEYPELGLGHKGTAEVGGLVLARIPADIVEDRKEYFREINEAHERSANENLLKVENRRMPIFDESETIVQTGGQRPRR